jgi:phosphatidate phosphatase APP1
VKNTVYILLLFLFASAIKPIAYSSESETDLEDRRHITFYNTYAYTNGDEWVIPVRIWVHKKRRWLQGISSWTVRIMGEYDPQSMEIFRSRITDVLADSKWRRTVRVQFENDSSGTAYRVKNLNGEALRTDRNGIVLGKIRISTEEAEKIIGDDLQEDRNVRVNVSSRQYSGTGVVRFMQPEGLSVISDIDDTIKITEIPAGSRIVVRNTFFKEYAAAPRMAEMYEELSEASFHYVSGSPWQLYRSLSGFLFSEKAGFPVGTFHMKNARKNVFTINSWRDLREFVTNENLTYEQKKNQIRQIMEHFPGRKFILIGDSGERDPEVYRAIIDQYSEQVKKVYIRDVVNDRELRPERFEGMTVIPAPTILRGITNK